MKVFFLVLSLVTNVIYAQHSDLRVGLYYGKSVQQLVVENVSGLFEVNIDSCVLDTIQAKCISKFQVDNGKVRFQLNGNKIGLYDTVSFRRLEDSCIFRLGTNDFKSNLRKFCGGVRIWNTGGNLTVVNDVKLDSYIAGVVEAESGIGRHLEYYKVQAIISRTYALSHKRKHKGVDICDQVDCQVYHGLSEKDSNITLAVAETKKMVLVDGDIQLVSAVFHSNCGGQTCNSEDVWSQPLNYLRSVRDPFCSHGINSNWQKIINKREWIRYLRKNVPDRFRPAAPLADFPIDYDQKIRRLNYTNAGYPLPLKKIRADWKLKSSFFSVQEIGGGVVLKGKGFGHGVGLCQEGAMEMAELGYGYTDIFKFYYPEVHLIDLDTIEFYRLEW